MSSARNSRQTIRSGSAAPESSSSTSLTMPAAPPPSQRRKSSASSSTQSAQHAHSHFYPHSLRDIRTDSTSNFGLMISQKPTALEEQRIQRLIEDKLLQEQEDEDERDSREEQTDEESEEDSYRERQQRREERQQGEADRANLQSDAADTTATILPNPADSSSSTAPPPTKAKPAAPPPTLPASLPCALPSSIQPSTTSVFSLRDLLPFVTHAVSTVIQDDFSRCFQSAHSPPWNWNFYLWPLWAMGVITRYFFLFPIRCLCLLIGALVWLFNLALIKTVVPQNKRAEWERWNIRFFCKAFVLSWTGVIRYHGTIAQHRPNQVYVANHTSLIDIVMLMQQHTYSLVGQRQQGFVGFMQRNVLNCLNNCFFDRAEADDRSAAARRIKEHIQSTDNNRLLIFPEGTCVTGDHLVLTRSGWRLLSDIHRAFEPAERKAAARPDVQVYSFNRDQCCAEWKPVERAQRFDEGRPDQRLFRMQANGMDVVATKDHRMLTVAVDRAKLVPRTFSFETVQQLAGRGYSQHANSRERGITDFAYSKDRAVVRSATNVQPAFLLSIAQLAATCAWWWQRDQMKGFLRFFGFWLSDGHLHTDKGIIAVSQRKLESTAWLIDLLDEVFPKWWHRQVKSDISWAGTTFNYTIRCPPLYEWLRVKAVGPPGYDPEDDAALRAYPHFVPDPNVKQAEENTAYYQLEGTGRGGRSEWKEADMLRAFQETASARRVCCECKEASGDRLSCAGKRCPTIARVHPRCARPRRAAKKAFTSPWYCSAAQCQTDRAAWELAWTTKHPNKALPYPYAAGAVSRWTSPASTVFSGVAENAKRRRISADDIGGSTAVNTADTEEVDEEEAEDDEDDLEPDDDDDDEGGEEGAVPVVTAVAGHYRVWNGGLWYINDARGWFYLKRWMGPDVADTFANLSQPQAVALLEGFCRADGTYAKVQFKGQAQEQPKGDWHCTNSSFPLIYHMQLIGQLAGAPSDLSLHHKKGTQAKKGPDGRPGLIHTVHHWRLSFNFNKTYGATNVSVNRLAKPVDVHDDPTARGYYEYDSKDDPYVYCLTVPGNETFLVQRLSRKRSKGHKDPDGKPGLAVRAHPVFVANCVNNEYIVQFKQGAFDMGAEVIPIAIKYNKIFVDAFWNSRAQAFPMHLLTLMCSWAVVCDVWYLSPQRRREAEGETAIEFSERVKRMIAERAGLKNVSWDGYLKHFRPSARYVKEQQSRVARAMMAKWEAIEGAAGDKRTSEESKEVTEAGDENAAASNQPVKSDGSGTSTSSPSYPIRRATRSRSRV